MSNQGTLLTCCGIGGWFLSMIIGLCYEPVNVGFKVVFVLAGMVATCLIVVWLSASKPQAKKEEIL